MRPLRSALSTWFLTCLAILIATNVTGRAIAQAVYNVTDLGVLPGGTSSFAWAINNRGQIVGEADTAGGVRHAFLWNGGILTDLGTLPGGAVSHAHAINNRGLVVGSSTVASGDRHAFIWQGGVFTDIGTLPGGSDGRAYGINDSGKVTGWSYSATGTLQSFFWQNGVLTNPGGFGGNYYYAAGVNNLGQVAGEGDRFVDDPTLHAGIWNANGTTVDLGSPSTLLPESHAWDINDHGQTVGDATDDSYGSGGTWHAVLWHKGKATDLGTLFDRPAAIAWHINNVGQVAGSSGIFYDQVSENTDTFADGHAFYWDSINGMLDINDRIDANSGWVLEEARGINDTGQIVGWGTNAQGQTHAYLLTPIALISVTIRPNPVPGSLNATCMVSLNFPALADVVVNLASTNPAATVSASVTIPAGTTSVTFTITTTAVTADTTGNIEATYNGVNRSKLLTVRPLGVQSVTLKPGSIKGGRTVTGTVGLEGVAAPGNIAVTFTSSDPSVVPAPVSVTVPAAQQTGAFTVSTNAVTTTTHVTISAAANGITRSVKLTVTP